VQFLRGLEGDLCVTFEEGTCAAWLCDLLTPHVEKLVLCDPRKNQLLPSGHKSDKVDAQTGRVAAPGPAVAGRRTTAAWSCLSCLVLGTGDKGVVTSNV
jgi:hypothetical protein